MSKREGRFAGPAPSHDEVQALLPWFANGTLDEAEHAWVEAHLTQCEECRAEAEDSRALGMAVRASETMAPAPHPAELARLLARIDAAEDGGFAPWRRLREALAGTPVTVRWALAAQLLLLVGAGALVLRQDRPASATFRTLSDAPAVDARAGAAEAKLRVMFREAATEAEVRALLLPLGAEIVAGPSPLGVYTLSLPAGAGRDPLSVVLAHLESRSEVRFVEAVPSEAAPAGER